MAEPLVRTDGEGLLADAGQRLERALQALEAVVARAPARTPPVAVEAQVVELDALRRRGRELEAAADEASQALGRAMAEVRQALEADDRVQMAQPSLFEEDALEGEPVDSPLESGPRLPDEEQTQAAESPAEEEPAA